MQELLVGCDGDSGRDALALATALGDASGATVRSTSMDRLASAAGAADAIVIGLTHRPKPAPIPVEGLIGPLLYGSPCPVVVAPHGYAAQEHPLNSVAIGYNGTPASESLVEVANDLATELGARVIVASAIEPAALASPFSRYLPILRKDVGSLLDALVARVSPGLGAEGLILEGDPATALASMDADLLIVASNRSGPAGQVCLGTTSAALIAAAQIPVMLVPRPAPHRTNGNAKQAATA